MPSRNLKRPLLIGLGLLQGPLVGCTGNPKDPAEESSTHATQTGGPTNESQTSDPSGCLGALPPDSTTSGGWPCLSTTGWPCLSSSGWSGSSEASDSFTASASGSGDGQDQTSDSGDQDAGDGYDDWTCLSEEYPEEYDNGDEYDEGDEAGTESSGTEGSGTESGASSEGTTDESTDTGETEAGLRAEVSARLLETLELPDDVAALLRQGVAGV